MLPDSRRCRQLARDGFAAVTTRRRFGAASNRVRAYFLTLDGTPRKAKGFGNRVHEGALRVRTGVEASSRDGRDDFAPSIDQAVRAFRRDLT